jgi:hypothetical protein
MNVRDLAVVACLLVATTGCASITKGTKGVTQVQIDNCAEVISCDGTNKKGTWKFSAPGPLKYKKSDDDMVIACEDGPGEQLSVRMSPTKSAMVWGNVLVGGVIGGGVDASTDAHWDYPESITLHRRYCNGVAVEPIPQTAPSVAPSPAAESNEPESETEPSSD